MTNDRPGADDDVRANGWEWAQVALLVANLIWTTLCLGGALPHTLVVTGMLTTLLLFVHLLERTDLFRLVRRARDEGSRRRRFHPAGWWLMPFLAYAAINVVWVTPVRWLGWQDWFCWAQGIAVFWVVLNGLRSASARQVLLATLLLLGFVSVVLGCYQRFVDPEWLMLGRVQATQFVGRASGPFGIPNSLGALLLLLIPPCGALVFRRDASSAERVFFAWLAGVLVFGLVLTISRGGFVALALTLTVWPLFSRRWRLRRRLAFAASILILMLLAGGVLYWQAPKVRERFIQTVREAGERTRPIMWRAAWQIFREHPWIGSGAGSYNTLFELHRPEHLQAEPKWTHNEYLNTLSDYGVVGFALFFGGIAVVVWRALRAAGGRAPLGAHRKLPSVPWSALRPAHIRLIDDPTLHKGMAMGLLAFALQLFVDFHFKIPALAMASATLAALTIGSVWPPKGDPVEVVTSRLPLSRMACAGVAAFIAVGSVTWNLPRLRAEAIRQSLRHELDALALRTLEPPEIQAIATRAREGFSAALKLDPANAQAWADRAYAAAILGNQQPDQEKGLGRDAESDARRALALSGAVSEFWLRLGVALDMQGRWHEAGPAFSEGLRLAPASATAWFYQAYHFALNSVTQPLARAAVATCLRLDGSIREADALRRRLSAGR